jgi:5-methyltetrahydrofolate--homocysteine methyltransferase
MSDSGEDIRIERLREAVVKYDLDNVEALAKAVLDAHVNPLAAIREGLAKGIKEVGDKYERGDAYLPELVMAATVMKKGIAILEPHLPAGADLGGLGKVVLGTVEGDIHDIGKSLVGTILGTSGFKVIDLGVDVSTDRFIEAVVKESPEILGMSALMTTTMVNMPKVVSVLASKGLRKNIVIMVGGAPTSKEWAMEIGADAHAGDAVEASSLAKKFVKEG